MDLIPVTEQTGIYGRPNFSYRGVFDPLDFGFNDNSALIPLASGGVVRDRCAQHEAGLHGIVRRCAQRRVPNHTQLRYTFNPPRRQPRHARSRTAIASVPSAVSYFLSPRWDQRDRTETMSFYAQDQWTLGTHHLQGGSGTTARGAGRPPKGNGTTETSKFNPNPITFEKTVSVRGFNDITPRFGLSYDLFGNGRTALKVRAASISKRQPAT
jgi:hypothetical protein